MNYYLWRFFLVDLELLPQVPDGAAALAVEILERIEEETTYARDAQLRDRLAVWRERLKAEVI